MHGLESTGVNKIGRSVSLRLANKTNFHKPKSSEFDSQHGKNLPLAELLLRVQNQDSWMFDRPSLYERRMKRKTQMAEAGQQQQQQTQQRQQPQSQQQRLQRRQQDLESGSKAAGLAVESSNRDSRTLTSAGTDSRLTKQPSATATTSSPSSLPATTMTTTATTKTNPERHPQRARTAKPALPPKPKAFPASSVQPPSSSSSSSLPSLENSKSMGRNNQVADSSSKIKEKTSPKVASSSSSSSTVPSINATPSTSEGCTLVLPRAELPSRFKRLLFKTPPRISSKHVERPKRLSILREANDDDDNDDGGGDDDDDNDDGNDNAGITGEEEEEDDDDDGAGGRKKKEIMHHNFKRNNITTNGGKIMDGGYDDDPEKYKTDLLKTLEWIQEELQQLKVKDRALFRSLLATGNEILKLRAQDGTNNNNSCDSQHQSSVDLSPSSVNISGQAEAEDSPVFH